MNRFRHFAMVLSVFSLALLFAAARLPAQKPSSDAPLVLNHVTVADVRTGTLQPDQTVIIEGNHITFVGPNKSVKFSDRAQLVDGRNLFVIPGLWDMHVHLVFGDWFPDAQEISLPLLVANGVTGVRDMGSELGIVQGWRNEIALTRSWCATWAANSASCRDGATRSSQGASSGRAFERPGRCSMGPSRAFQAPLRSPHRKTA